MTYTAPLEDMRFVLNEIVNLPEISSLPGYEEATPDLVDAVLGEAGRLAGEVLACELAPGTRITYDDAPKPGLEHHLFLLEGRLSVTVDGRGHDLQVGDCLRYQLFGPSAFATPDDCGARYVLVVL